LYQAVILQKKEGYMNIYGHILYISICLYVFIYIYIYFHITNFLSGYMYKREVIFYTFIRVSKYQYFGYIGCCNQYRYMILKRTPTRIQTCKKWFYDFLHLSI